MKRVNLQMLGVSVNDLLTREQMKKVMGGDEGSGSGSGDNRAAGSYKCCPKDQPNSAQCSTCVTVPKGSHAVCEQGVVTTC